MMLQCMSNAIKAVFGSDLFFVSEAESKLFDVVNELLFFKQNSRTSILLYAKSCFHLSNARYVSHRFV